MSNLSGNVLLLLSVLRHGHENDVTFDADGNAWFLVRTVVARDASIDPRSLGGLFSKLKREGFYKSLDIQGNWGEILGTPEMLAHYNASR